MWLRSCLLLSIAIAAFSAAWAWSAHIRLTYERAERQLEAKRVLDAAREDLHRTSELNLTLSERLADAALGARERADAAWTVVNGVTHGAWKTLTRRQLRTWSTPIS